MRRWALGVLIMLTSGVCVATAQAAPRAGAPAAPTTHSAQRTIRQYATIMQAIFDIHKDGKVNANDGPDARPLIRAVDGYRGPGLKRGHKDGVASVSEISKYLKNAAGPDGKLTPDEFSRIWRRL